MSTAPDLVASEPLLQLQDVQLRLPTAHGLVPALRGLSLRLDKGQTLGLIGESGCGKSLTALAIMLTAIYGPGLVVSITAIGLFNIPVFARVTRGAAQSVWTREFILAAQAAGKGRWRITFDHVLPNIASVLIVQATVQFAIAILAEAALSYLGLGTLPPQASWGRMLNEAQAQMFQAPWLAVYPGVAIALAVLGLNLMGDGLRDLLDPRLARQR